MKEKEIKYNFICEKCDYKCRFESHWKNHINTELHLTGQRKTRSDLKEPLNVKNVITKLKI